MTNRLSSRANVGQVSGEVPSRTGAKRNIDRGNAPPLAHVEGSLAFAWTRGELTCPAGTYQAALRDGERLSIETPRQLPAKSCEKCPRGRFGAANGLTSKEACARCPPGIGRGREWWLALDPENVTLLRLWAPFLSGAPAISRALWAEERGD